MGNVPVLEPRDIYVHVTLVASRHFSGSKSKMASSSDPKGQKMLKTRFLFWYNPNWVIKMSSVLESIRTRSGVTDDLKVSLDLENQELISTNFHQYHQEHPMFSNGTCGKCNL